MIEAWPLQLRGGVGVKAANLADKTGDIVNAQILTKDDEALILTSKKGQIMRIPLKSVPRLTRDTQGVIIMRLSGDDKVAAATIVQKNINEKDIEKEATANIKMQPIVKPTPNTKPIVKKTNAAKKLIKKSKLPKKVAPKKKK